MKSNDNKERIPGTENMAIEVAFNSLKIANVRKARKPEEDSTRIDFTITFRYLNRKTMGPSFQWSRRWHYCGRRTKKQSSFRTISVKIFIVKTEMPCLDGLKAFILILKTYNTITKRYLYKRERSESDGKKKQTFRQSRRKQAS